jgi:NADH-quinone oxidoreductase subunit L
MFRLVFMTFHGEERFATAGPSTDSGQGHGHAADQGHAAHGHAHGAPHEAPMSMAVPLILLAIGSTVAGFVGVPHALFGHNRIEGFLEPAFEVHGPAEAGAEPAAVAGHTPAETPAEGRVDDAIATERMLMALSVGVAIAGLGIAGFFWLRRGDAAAALAQQFGGVYRTLLNKYYLDEIYDALFVQPIKRTSESALWKGMDAGLIDGTVNGVGAVVSGASQVLRQAQTGSVRTYAASLFLGVVMILGWYLWT